MDKRKFTRVCISDSAHSLMFYLMMSSQEEIDDTFFFFSDGIHPSIREKIPQKHYIPSVSFRRNLFRKILFFFYLSLLHATARLRWPFLKTAKIFAMDYLHFAPALIGKRHYIHLADGPNCFFNLLTTPEYQKVLPENNRSWYVPVIRFFLGDCWHKAYGVSPNCDMVVCTTPDRLPQHESKENRTYDLFKLWQKASEEQRNFILHVFDITKDDYESMKKRSVVLLTQQLATEGTVTEEELVKIYSDLLKMFPADSILIKRHPRDRVDYRKYFPQALVYDKFAPMQIFAAAGITFRTAVTLFSSSVTAFPEAEIVWGGSKVHPAIFRRYGDQKLSGGK